ncbi:MAG: DNA-binding protein [Intestinibacter bartlettii]|uniref:ribbon-helix-helix domain-containing protein n=1 Tax=Intestinibacter bartlettii TaxID=261299 RepID=UPI0026EF4E0A|nr:DNA-binding protein [Intestinibacter bartlettii]MDO5011535.1 DNA-binding protein [Intestinibacter bartlettii]
MAINKDVNTRIALTLPIEVKNKLDQLAKEDNRTTSNYIQNIIMKHLEKIEKGN